MRMLADGWKGIAGYHSPDDSSLSGDIDIYFQPLSVGIGIVSIGIIRYLQRKVHL